MNQAVGKCCKMLHNGIVSFIIRRMDMKQIVMIALYLIDVTLCLVAIRQRFLLVSRATKPLLMPLLCCVYLALLPQSLMTFRQQVLLVLALGFHTLGDVLLLLPRNKTLKYFYAGMLDFFVGHIMYALWFATAAVGHDIWCAILILVASIILQYLLYRQLMDGHKKYISKFLPYSCGLSLVAISIASTLGNGSPGYATLVSMAGILLFCFSDYCILRRVIRKPLYGQMVVMSTYIVAQSLIVLGALLLQI